MSTWSPGGSDRPATVPTFTIVAIASRAFATHCALQSVLAVRTSTGLLRKIAYSALGVLLAAVTALAEPVG